METIEQEATTPQRNPTPEPPPSFPPMVTKRFFWGTLAIIVVWVAVLFVGVFGESDLVVESATVGIEVPVVWGLALLAFLATWVIAVSALRDD